MNTVNYDVIIIGGGPGGLTAAIYTSREKLNTLLLEKVLCGGLPAVTELIENYSGFPEGIKGLELVDKFKKQAQKFGAEIVEFNEVIKVEPAEKRIKVKTNKSEYSAYTVIIASGSNPQRLNISGEKEYTGKGVSYCALCDGPLYKGRTILVVGGGNAAAEEALFLSKFAREVILTHRRNELRADGILQERLKRDKKIKLVLNHIPISINGKDFVESVTVKDKDTNKESKIEVSGVFIYIGFLPNSGFMKGIVELNNSGYIVSNEKMETSQPGIYAVGDVRSKSVRQIITACAEGAIAAVSAREYIKAIG